MPKVKSYRPISPKRKKTHRVSLQPSSARRLAIFIGTMSLCVFGLWWYFNGSAIKSSLSQSLELAFAHMGFRLEDVVVEGRMRTDKNLILQKVNLVRGKPLFSIDLLEAKEKLEALSWIKAVKVERRFPDTLFIRISEKEPVALWLNHSKAYLVDRDGELVETKEAHKHKNLLLITGYKAPQEVGKLIALLEKFPQIKKRVTAATHLRSARWDIRLEDRLDVKLPEKEAELALSYLMDIEKNHNLMEKKVISIDMRLPGHLILRLTPEEAQRKNGTGKDA